MEKNIDKAIPEYFTKRRTIRNYEAREVDDNLLKNILSAAEKAPTCGNMQLYSVIVTRDAKRREELAALHFNQPASKAPVLLTVCADLERMTRWGMLRHADVGFDNLLSWSSAIADAYIYAQQIVTIAEMKGLGTCYLGTATYNAPEIAALLHLPERVVPVACISLGWPAEAGQATERLPLEAIMHNEDYRNDSDDEFLLLHKEKEEYPQNKEYVKENGKENLAQVFTEVRYPRAMNEDFSRKLTEWMGDKI